MRGKEKIGLIVLNSLLTESDCVRAQRNPAGIVTEPSITLILPAYNESATIGGTISKTIEYFNQRGYTYQIIVAADGNDGTRELVADLGKTNPAVEVIGHAERLGKGRGVREAVARATGAVVGYADADYKVPIEEF